MLKKTTTLICSVLYAVKIVKTLEQMDFFVTFDAFITLTHWENKLRITESAGLIKSCKEKELLASPNHIFHSLSTGWLSEQAQTLSTLAYDNPLPPGLAWVLFKAGRISG